MQESLEKIKEQERPPVLYHGSISPDLEEVEPRRTRWRDKNEGPRVFATPDKRLATIFAGKNERVVRSGKFNDTPYAVIIGSAEEFMKEDVGGHIYTLSTDGFEYDPQKGLGENEWTCQSKVKPLDKTRLDSALDAMIDEGVQVYFVDEETNLAIGKSKDHGYSILKSIRSENQRRGKNVVDF